LLRMTALKCLVAELIFAENKKDRNLRSISIKMQWLTTKKVL